jgi:hypothetical protein
VGPKQTSTVGPNQVDIPRPDAAAADIRAAAGAVAAAASSALSGVNPFTPGHATGTGMGTFQGWTEVGEQGPELVNFGTPVQILSNHQSQQAGIGSNAIADRARTLVLHP